MSMSICAELLPQAMNHQPMPSMVAMRIRLAPMVTRCAAGMRTRLFFARARSTARRLIRIIGHPPGAARDPPPPRPSARRRPPLTPNFAASNATRLNGSKSSTGAWKRSRQHLDEPFGARRAAAHDDARDAIVGRRRLEEIEGLLHLEHHVLGHRAQHRPGIVEGDAIDRLAALERVGLLERQIQLFLQRFGVGVAAGRDVAGEDRLVAVQDVDVGRAGAGIEQDDDGIRLGAVVGFVGVLQRESVDVDDHRDAARLADDARVVGDLLFLRGDEQDVHRALPADVAAVENLVVQVDVLDVERDVLLRFPVDRLGEFGLRHRRQRNLLHDDGVTRERRGHVLGRNLQAVEQPADRVDDSGAVDDGAVDDAVRRNRLAAKRRDFEGLACRPELDGLDRARTDVQADE